jgi:hypothetical protein
LHRRLYRKKEEVQEERTVWIGDLRSQDAGNEWISIHQKSQGNKTASKSIFISAFEIDDIEFRRELPFVKVDEFIQKPILLEDLISMVNKHINI